MKCPLNTRFTKEVKCVINIVIDTSDEKKCNKELKKIMPLIKNWDICVQVEFKNLKKNDK